MPLAQTKTYPEDMATTPKVQLVNFFDQPFNNAIATARTCYSSRVIMPNEVAATPEKKQQRNQIAESIFKAGHHTTLQHGHFQFILERVSRQFLWSFLHSHPFYNSEQVSQRYVEVKPGNYFVPALKQKPLDIFLTTVDMQNARYQELTEVLMPTVLEQYKKIFPRRKYDDPKWQRALKKKSMEVARYVLPIATFAHLYHTVSGLTLHRYAKLCRQMDVPTETRAVVEAMLAEVKRADPDFFLTVEDALPLEDTFEFQALSKAIPHNNARETAVFLKEFDQSLGNKTSVLVSNNHGAQQIMAQAVRSILGVSVHQLSDEKAIALLLDPTQNPYLKESLNLNSLSKLTRPLQHAFFTFRKKLSHTADSQDQRHRLTPGSRPILQNHFCPNTPDFITPPLVQQSQQALDIYEKTMQETWAAIRRLLQEQVSLENALYLLPNAFPIRFEESGDLLGFHHKWTTRLCYTAQEEIWNNCRDEVLQVQQIFPEIGKWLFPPCTLRHLAKETPFCPEGERFCGVMVWKMQVPEFERLL